MSKTFFMFENFFEILKLGLKKRATFFLILIFALPIASASSKGKYSPPAKVKALVVYACDSDDHYPFPSEELRKSIYSRMSDFFKTMSYGAHQLSFKEVHNNGAYFVSTHPAQYYRQRYDPKKHVHGFAMFNEEILNTVKAEKGDKFFRDVDMIIMAGTDGGPNWYTRGVNATGYGMLGVDFTAGSKTFGKGQGQGGITLEIGSSAGTPDPDDDVFFGKSTLFWSFAHEYSHWLRLGHRNEMGLYSLMCDRSFDNATPKFGPPPLDIFSIMRLGWLDESDSDRVKIVTGEPGVTAFTLNQIRSTKGLVLARIDVPNFHERFYLSYHRQDANLFDGVYGGEGLLIWRKSGSSIRMESPGPRQDQGKSETKPGSQSTDFWRTGDEAQFHINAYRRFNIHSKQTALGIVIADIREEGNRVRFKVKIRRL